jgi:hypothetical protein
MKINGMSERSRFTQTEWGKPLQPVTKELVHKDKTYFFKNS